MRAEISFLQRPSVPAPRRNAKNVVLLLGDVELAQQFVGSVRQLRGWA